MNKVQNRFGKNLRCRVSMRAIIVKDFILAGYENVNFNYVAEEYYCMSVPLFLKCYLYDFSKAALYLSLPILVSAANFYILRKNGENVVFNMCKDLLLIFGILFSFWAFTISFATCK